MLQSENEKMQENTETQTKQSQLWQPTRQTGVAFGPSPLYETFHGDV